jgi:hypothetical protein
VGEGPARGLARSNLEIGDLVMTDDDAAADQLIFPETGGL